MHHMVFHCKLDRFYVIMFVSQNCVTDVSGLMVMLGHFHGPPSCSDPFVVVKTCDSISKDPRSRRMFIRSGSNTPNGTWFGATWFVDIRHIFHQCSRRRMFKE